MEKIKTGRKWLWWFSLGGALIILYKLSGSLSGIWDVLGTLLGILAPFVAGFFLAFLLYGPSNWLEKRFLRCRKKFWQRMARPLALLIVYLLLLGALALVISLVIPRLITSVSGLVVSIPDYIDAAQTRLQAWVDPDGPLGRFNLAQRLDAVYQSLLDTITRLLSTENMMNALKGVVNVTSSLVDVIISVMVSLYMLSGRENLIRELKSVLGLFCKPRHIAVLGQYSRRIASIFYGYFYGVFLDSMVVGVVVTIGLLIFRVPYGVLLGMMLGLLNMIPYFGALIGTVGIVLITLLSRNIYAAIGVAIYIIVVQQIDGNIVQPRVVGNSVGLRPIYVLLSITLFGGLFGFWGIFLAVPLMAVVQMLVKDAISWKKQRASLAASAPDGTAPADAPADEK